MKRGWDIDRIACTSMWIILGLVFLVMGGGVLHHKELRKQKYNKTSEIKAAYMHEAGRYSIMVQDANTLSLVKLGYATIKTDVTAGSNIWYEATYNGMNECVESTIHLHSVDDLNTAGWNHGKFGSGTTHRIDK